MNSVLMGLLLLVAGDMVELVCEARIIAEHSQFLTREQWVEVIDVSESQGAFTADHAQSLRDLIDEAYAQREKGNLAFWVYYHCGADSSLLPVQSEHWLPGRKIQRAPALSTPSDDYCARFVGDAIAVLRWRDSGNSLEGLRAALKPDMSAEDRRYVEWVIEFAWTWGGEEDLGFLLAAEKACRARQI